jgi:HK97 family phage major capsid protein
MFKNIEHMKQQKQPLIKEARALTDLAEKEHRNLTPEEKNKCDVLLRNLKDLDTEIDIEERKQQIMMAGGTVSDSVVYGPTWNKPNRSLNMGIEDRAFLKYAREGLRSLNDEERRALVLDSVGQYLVSPAVEAQLERSIAEQVVVRQIASRKATDKDRIIVRGLSEASVGWGRLETGTDITESTLVPETRTVYIEDLYGLSKVGEDEIADSDLSLAAFLSDTFARAVAEKENYAFWKGRGHSFEEPDGITVDSTLVAAAKTTAAHSAVTIDDFMQMVYAVPAAIRKGSSFVVNSLTELELRKLRAGGSTTTDGPYLWQPSVAADRPNQFLGYDIYTDDTLDDLSDTDGVIGVFGRFDLGYRILDRQGVSVQRLDELYAEAGLVGFKLRYRVGGYCIKPANKALVLLKEHSA